MKKVGLIGGTGPESTLVYYRELNRLVNDSVGGNAFPEIAIESVDLFKALGLVGGKKYDELTEYLLTAARNLEKGGADIIALTAGTMHVVYDRLKPQIGVPFISIPETVAACAAEKGYRRLGLLGTIFTMENDFLSGAFSRRGIDIFVPDSEQRSAINAIIGGELEYGVVKEESRATLIREIESMKREHGIEAVILGCTELPLALNDENTPVPCLDIMAIHIKELVRLITD